MKRISILCLLLVFWHLSFAGNEKRVNPEIKEATVFLNRAQLNSTASTNLDAGVNEVMFYGLPAGIDPQSIQVSGKGNFIILGVKFDQNYTEPHKKSSELIKLQDSLHYYEFQLQTLHNFADVIKKEEQLLIANQNINGKEKALDADDLEYMADFFRKRMLDMRYQLLKNEREIKDMNEKVVAFRNQVNQLQQNQVATGRIVVSTQAKAKTPASFDITYVVHNAGWNPIYDVRAKGTDTPIQLGYKARVWQNTGMDWKDIKINLSTTNPSLGGIKPELSTWWIYLQEPVQMKKKSPSPMKARSQMAPRSEGYSNQDQMSKEYKAESTADYTVTTETSLSTSYAIGIPYSIPNGGDGQTVDIRNFDLPATYQHSAIPKLNESAFLVANVTGWDTLEIISGVANIFFEGTFVGESYLDLENTGDSLTFSLGRDNNVVIERTPVKDLQSKSFLGLNKKQEYAYDITIRNTKKSPINITVEDQIPVSKNEKLEIELTDSGGAIFNKETGKLIWKLQLNPGETVKKRFKYSVKYPSGKVVRGIY